MQIKTPIYQNGYHQILQITSVGKYVEKREPLYIVSENINWCNHYGKEYGAFSKQNNNDKLKQNYYMIQHVQFWVYIWKKQKH